ncbi:MMPL family transporter [Shewanella sp. AS1]|uniref:MMPL family transporter n=1 Tax=Shewanella sp. AS1 TaxID=2907626 RepID=UPI001F1807DE|nr:MMPL family transporter [Shewanella sp. AS1]MCE9680353.1 MMPL family transporter [Shewanella sp. AS1]
MIAALSQGLDRISSRVKFTLWILLLFFMATLGGIQLYQGAKIQSDILAMLPKIDETPLTQKALNRVEQELADRLYIALVTPSKTESIRAAKRLMAELAPHKNTFSQISSAGSEDAQALNQFYFGHRFKLLTETQAKLLAEGKLQALTNKALAQIYNPFGYANSGLLSQDPLLLYPDNLAALAPGKQLSSEQGILLSKMPGSDQAEPHVAAIVMLKGVGSVFSPSVQAWQNQVLDRALETTRTVLEQADPSAELKVLKAGALFHASAATIQAKREVSTLGAASLIGVILLVWLAFRSVLPLGIASLTIATSLLFALSATFTLFGELHLLTLVFGTSLIGIAIDYSFHFYCERLCHSDSDNQENASQTIVRIFPAASLALLTTVLAYIGIGLTPFPGMQQVAIFCAAGLIGAYLTLLLAYPKLANGALKPRPQPLALAKNYLSRLASLKGASRHTLLIAVGIALLIGITGLSQLRVNDDIRALQKSPEAVMQQEQQVRQLLSGGTDNQFLLVSADDPQQLLQRLEALSEPLEKLQQQGAIQNSINLASYLPSLSKQQTNYRLQGEIYHNLPHVLANLGLDSALASPLAQAYQANAASYIEPSAFFASKAGEQFAPLWLAPDAQSANYGSIVLLGGIQDLTNLQETIAPFTQVQLVDKVADISSVMAKYRQLTLGLLALALLLAAIIFSLRFGLKLALLVTGVPAVAALFTLALLGLFDSPLTLFHALALILVFGIGVDYSLFFAESHQGQGVMMAVFMSACSTLMAFGLLAFSQTPAIHYFGLTLLLGIALTFLLSPLINTYTRNTK